MKLEVGPAHVAKHHGRLDDTRVGFDNEAVLALLRGWDNQAVSHLAVVAGVLVGGLKTQTQQPSSVLDENAAQT